MVVFVSYTQSHPRLGLAARSRHITHPRIWGLCHWAGETAGHLGAESPSRRTAGPASARIASRPCPYSTPIARVVPGAVRECDVPVPLCSAFRLLSSLSYSHAWPFAVAKATQVCTRNRTNPVAVEESPPSRDPTTRPLRRSPRHPGLSLRPPTSDVGACHRVVRRHTCCSPVTRRSMRAIQARAAPGVNVGQPAPKAASKLSHEARRSSEECVGSPESQKPRTSIFLPGLRLVQH